MGAILGIAQGSKKPARLAILRYRGGGSKTLAFVGKGVTFDKRRPVAQGQRPRCST